MPVSVVPNTGRESVRIMYRYTGIYICRLNGVCGMCVGKRMLERERGDKYNDECPVAGVDMNFVGGSFLINTSTSTSRDT